jgi:hypothetical protein
MDNLPVFHIVHTYLRSDLSSMMNLQDLMKTTILPRLKKRSGIDNEAAIQQLLEREDFTRKSRFSGTIHCEATLMALVHSFSSAVPLQKEVPPFSKQRTMELMPLFLVRIPSQ